MFKRLVENKLKAQLESDVVVKMVVEQDLIWVGHTEVRAYCDGGKIYSCLVDGDEQIGEFIEVPKEQK